MSETCLSCGTMLMPSPAGRGWRYCPNKDCKTNQPSEPHVVSAPRDAELDAAVRALTEAVSYWKDPRGETVTVDAHDVTVVLKALKEKMKNG